MKKIISLSSIVLLSTLVMAPAALAEEVASSTITSNGSVRFKANTEITKPVNPEKPGENIEPIDPTDPDGKPSPGTNGPLSIDFASSLDFGLNKISSEDQTYYARAQKAKMQAGEEIKEISTANYIQVTDGRGTNAGWTLKVKQNGQFKATGTSVLNNTLTGATINFKDAEVVSQSTSAKADANMTDGGVTLNAEDMSETIILSAKKDAGSGTWVNKWGNVENVKEENEAKELVDVAITKAITLFVPGATAKDAVEYRTELVWSLSDVPGNE